MLAFSNDYYGMIFRATQSVELFCAYFQSVHHVTFILCYTVLSDFLALVFALIRVRKHWWDNITRGKQ